MHICVGNGCEGMGQYAGPAVSSWWTDVLYKLGFTKDPALTFAAGAESSPTLKAPPAPQTRYAMEYWTPEWMAESTAQQYQQYVEQQAAIQRAVQPTEGYAQPSVPPVPGDSNGASWTLVAILAGAAVLLFAVAKR